jgi:hypothetical protein
LLAGLNQVLHIDAAARKAIVQPVVSNRDLLAALQPHGLAFPSGHCPQVKVSGYGHAPPAMQAAAAADGGIVLMVSAVAFADSDDDGRQQLAPAPPLPIPRKVPGVDVCRRGVSGQGLFGRGPGLLLAAFASCFPRLRRGSG